jgi:hypothetical protein
MFLLPTPQTLLMLTVLLCYERSGVHYFGAAAAAIVHALLLLILLLFLGTAKVLLLLQPSSCYLRNLHVQVLQLLPQLSLL